MAFRFKTRGVLFSRIFTLSNHRFPTIQRRPMSGFRAVEHVIRAQHSRDRFAGAELGHENDLRLHVKQYIPESNPNPKPGDVSVIGAGADAFPKEMYEPFWQDFCRTMEAKGRRVRSIWVADPVNQGHSGVMNETILGPDPSWWDHGRDLLFMINQFQDEIQHPIVGIGHSMGSGHLTHLALLHPRLLHSLVLIDVVYQRQPAGIPWASASVNRRDVWPTRKQAEDKFRSNKAFQKWDPRILEKYLEHGLRDLPTEMHPELPAESDPKDPPVTLQTTKAQEQYNYIRAAYPDERYLLQEGELFQDFWPEELEENPPPFGRAENKAFFRKLPELKPSVLYVYGTQSDVSTPELRRARMERTGVGGGGSGGVAKGRVKEVGLECGHLVPFERTTDSADACAEYLTEDLDRWDREEQNRKERWEKLSRRERVDINDLWREKLGAKKQDGERKTKL